MGLLKSRTTLVFGHFEIKVDTEKSQVEDQITYLYKYEIDWQNSPLKADISVVSARDEAHQASAHGKLCFAKVRVAYTQQLCSHQWCAGRDHPTCRSLDSLVFERPGSSGCLLSNAGR